LTISRHEYPRFIAKEMNSDSCVGVGVWDVAIGRLAIGDWRWVWRLVWRLRLAFGVWIGLGFGVGVGDWRIGDWRWRLRLRWGDGRLAMAIGLV